MWTDFQNSFTDWFVEKISMYTLQRFPPHLQYVATLPCEIWKSKNVTEFFMLNVTINMFNLNLL